jgi:hypothetical protein
VPHGDPKAHSERPKGVPYKKHMHDFVHDFNAHICVAHRFDVHIN